MTERLSGLIARWWCWLVALGLVVGLGMVGVMKVEGEEKAEAVETQVPIEESVRAYLFYGEGCPHCGKMIEFWRGYQAENPGKVEVYLIEIYSNGDNLRLFSQMGQQLGAEAAGVPLLVIGDQVVVGFGSDETTGEQIRGLVEECEQEGCEDVLGRAVDLKQGEVTDLWLNRIEIETVDGKFREESMWEEPVKEQVETGSTELEVPGVGTVELRNLSLPVLSVLIGFIDGFNPCAMWVLVFLIGLLLDMQDRKRMWLLGLAFILTSGFVYLLFMTAWLKFFLFVGLVPVVRLVIGLVAVGSGVAHLKKWYEHKTGCEVIPVERRRRVFGRLERITRNQQLAIALVGIVLLAFSVNLVELVCSAGLPAIYTNVLSMSELGWWAYAINIGLYMFMFMIDDLFVFVVAMKTLQVTGISGKYTHWANLVGGVVIGLLGLALVFKPGWVMFA